MLRILRAFAWLRWRVLLNSLERRGSRDALERFSLAVEQLAPIIAGVVLMVPSALGLAGCSGLCRLDARLRRAAGDSSFELLSFLLLAAASSPSSARSCCRRRAHQRRAPAAAADSARRAVSRAGMSALGRSLDAARRGGRVGLPVGLAAGGRRRGRGRWPRRRALLLIASLVGIALAVTSAVHLVVRDRRRGELLALFVVVVLPMIGMLPALDGRAPPARPPIKRASREKSAAPSAIERQVFAAVPSELYVRTVRRCARRRPGSSATALAALTGVGTALHLLAFAVFVRVLGSRRSPVRARVAGGAAQRGGSPASLARHIGGRARPRYGWPPHAARRSTLLSPIVVFGMFAS